MYVPPLAPPHASLSLEAFWGLTTAGGVFTRNRANLPIFTFPGLSCIYMGINYYQIFLVYLIFPVALLVWVYLSYRVVLVLMQRKKR